MDKNWFPRLVEVIEADKRSKRDISLAAKFGPNYVQQMIKNGKQPTMDNFLDLLDVLGLAHTFYILTGIEFGPEDEEFLRIALAMPPRIREKLKHLLLEVESEPDLAPRPFDAG